MPRCVGRHWWVRRWRPRRHRLTHKWGNGPRMLRGSRRHWWGWRWRPRRHHLTYKWGNGPRMPRGRGRHWWGWRWVDRRHHLTNTCSCHWLRGRVAREPGCHHQQQNHQSKDKAFHGIPFLTRLCSCRVCTALIMLRGPERSNCVGCVETAAFDVEALVLVASGWLDLYEQDRGS